MAALRDLFLGGGRVVPARLLSVRFSRSGGPGGQHVNKVETRADLRCDLDGAREVLGDERVERVRARYSARLDAEGRLCVVCEETRSQARNVELAHERMEELLRAALVVPKKRRPTRPTRGSQQRRLAGKKRRGEVKRGRRPPPGDGD